MKERIALAREIAARTATRFLEIKPERKKRGFTKEELHRLKYGRDWAELEFERRVRTWNDSAQKETRLHCTDRPGFPICVEVVSTGLGGLGRSLSPG